MSDGTFLYASLPERPDPVIIPNVTTPSAFYDIGASDLAYNNAWGAAFQFNLTATINNEAGGCALPTPLVPVYTMPLANEFNFYMINVIVSASCVAFASLLNIALMYRHWTNLTMPQEQINILRICAFIPLYGLGTILMIVYPNSYAYMYGWLKFLEAICIVYFFIMMLWFMAPQLSAEPRVMPGDETEVYMSLHSNVNHQKGWPMTKSAGTYQRRYFVILQCPITNFLAAVFSDITQHTGHYCITSKDKDDAHLWVEIVQIISVIIAVVAIIKEAKANKAQLSHTKTMTKLVAFKLIIGIQVLQNIIYMILEAIDNTPLKPTLYMSSVDFLVGIPNLVIAIVLFFASIFFHFAYSVSPYLASKGPSLLDNGDSRQPRVVKLRGLQVLAAVLSPHQLISIYKFLFKIPFVAKSMDRAAPRQQPAYYSQGYQSHEQGYNGGYYPTQSYSQGYEQGVLQEQGYPMRPPHYKPASPESSPDGRPPRF